MMVYNLRKMKKNTLTFKNIVIVLVVMCFIVGVIGLVSWLQLHQSLANVEKRTTRFEIQDAPRTILITGVAGFIGFHLARTLTFESQNVVVGIDNFSEYYDVRLKEDRAYELHKLGVRLFEGDLCDAAFLEETFLMFSFTHVVHLASQPGVRYSLDNPLVYIRENIKCYLNLLEVMKKFPYCKLIFASSSSVYGHDSATPFVITESLSRPGNVYAATKLADETLSYSYCATYNLTMVGLRFFTVYGPWGRPDMAVYKFAEKILENEPVPKFETNDGILERDFTYIDDIVDGVMATLSYTPSRCGEVFNLGYGHPENLLKMIGYLEEAVGKKAVLAPKPVPPSELLKTYADISLSRQLLGYNPTTSLKIGVEKFIEWLNEYRQRRKKEYKTKKSPSRDFRNKLRKEKEKRIKRLEEKELKRKNAELNERLEINKQIYLTYAKENNISVPIIKKDKFDFYKDKSSDGNMIMKLGSSYNDKQNLLQKCLDIDQCIAVRSDGYLMSKIQPQKNWLTRMGEPGTGLYVADIDICEADLHDCDVNAGCHHTGPAQYQCRCHPGYYGNGRFCIPRYLPDQEFPLRVRRDLLIHKFNGIDITSMKKSTNFVFFEGFDSNGGDFIAAEQFKGNIPMLESLCRNLTQCIAFNSNGLLKMSVSHPGDLVKWIGKSSGGVYIADLDYCMLGNYECPEDTRCNRLGPANYRCMPIVAMTATSDELSAEDVGKSDQEKTVMTKVIPGKENAGISDDIHIIISADNDHFIGVATLINSILHTARLPSNIKFHIVVAGQPAESFKEYLQCCGLQVTDKINVIELNDSWLSGRIHVFSSIKDVGNLASLANFARFYFDRIFPSLQKALYIDADCVVQQPIEDLWNIAKDAKTPLVAVSRDIVPYGHFFDEKVLKVFFERYGKRFSESEPTFNAGVFVIDLLHYREKQLVDEAEFWMNQNAKKKLWKFGSQPVMLMMYHGQWTKLDSTWNVDSLGWKDTIGTEKLKTAGILHWNGAKKPWLHNGLYKAYWQRYQPSQCSGHGNCVSNSTARNGSYWYCQCGVGYHGKYCLESSIP